MAGHILLLRIVTELSDVDVLAEKQPIMIHAKTPGLVFPDYQFGTTAEMQPNVARVKESADGQSEEHLAFAKVPLWKSVLATKLHCSVKAHPTAGMKMFLLHRGFVRHSNTPCRFYQCS